jgi:hypothetical protein
MSVHPSQQVVGENEQLGREEIRAYQIYLAEEREGVSRHPNRRSQRPAVLLRHHFTTRLDRMIEDMTVRNFAPNTQESYLSQVSLLARHFGKSPERGEKKKEPLAATEASWGLRMTGNR